MVYAVRRPVENVYLVRERDRRRTRELLALVLAAIPPMLWQASARFSLSSSGWRGNSPEMTAFEYGVRTC